MHIKRWLRSVLIVLAIFAVWFAVSVITFVDDPRIDMAIEHTQ